MKQNFASMLARSVPFGWRFYTCDASIDGKYSIRLVRDEDGRNWWRSLPGPIKDLVRLYASGGGASFDEALDEAAKECLLFESDEDEK